ncbi:MAG: DUF1266 domain-containing protein, partial [Microbacterium sp.]
MRPAARINLNDLGVLLDWLVGQWWVYVIVGLILVFLIWIFFAPVAKLKTSPEYETTGTEANELALGLLQIVNDPTGNWNDPTANLLTGKLRDTLVEQWGLHSREDWLANIDRLVKTRRRRDDWVLMLGIRKDLAATLGREPKPREWTKAIIEAGGNKREATTFVNTVGTCEVCLRKSAGKKWIPADNFVTTFDGYAFGQAVAVVTWGVALGFAEVGEARRLIHEINDVARPEFSSWVEFGSSYIVGRVMHWSDGQLGDKTWDRLGHSTA